MIEGSADRPVIRVFQQSDTAAVIELWTRCGLIRSWNDPHKDIDRKLADSADLFFVIPSPEDSSPSDEAKSDVTKTDVTNTVETVPAIVASVMAGYEGHRGWINYLAVDPTQQRKGLGRLLMAHVENELSARNCPKINLQVREGNTEGITFYRCLGYQVDAAVSLGKRLIPDD